MIVVVSVDVAVDVVVAVADTGRGYVKARDLDGTLPASRYGLPEA